MFKQIRLYLCPHGVQDKIDSFPARQFCRRHKIAVASNQNDLVRLFLVSQRGNIYAYSHIYAFLLRNKKKIIFR